MKRKIAYAVFVFLFCEASLHRPQPAEASIMCRWFGYCVYESPGFKIKVVDKETGQPLSDVHALAEWISYGLPGQYSPLMVQEAVSGADGVLIFPAWGPSRGSSDGLVLNMDPGITLFKLGYKSLLVQNAYPKGTTETTRLRLFGQDGQTFALEPFRGTLEEWFDELRKFPRGIPGKGLTPELSRKFGRLYLNRMQQVWAELQKLPKGNRDIENYIRAFEDDLKRLGGLQE